jgi:predicted acetyltransferase
MSSSPQESIALDFLDDTDDSSFSSLGIDGNKHSTPLSWYWRGSLLRPFHFRKPLPPLGFTLADPISFVVAEPPWLPIPPVTSQGPVLAGTIPQRPRELPLPPSPARDPAAIATPPCPRGRNKSPRARGGQHQRAVRSFDMSSSPQESTALDFLDDTDDSSFSNLGIDGNEHSTPLSWYWRGSLLRPFRFRKPLPPLGFTLDGPISFAVAEPPWLPIPPMSPQGPVLAGTIPRRPRELPLPPSPARDPAAIATPPCPRGRDKSPRARGVSTSARSVRSIARVPTSA